MHHRLCVTGSSPRDCPSSRRKTRHHFDRSEIARDSLKGCISGARALYLQVQGLRQKSELLPSHERPGLKSRRPSVKIRPHRNDCADRRRHPQMASEKAHVAV